MQNNDCAPLWFRWEATQKGGCPSRIEMSSMLQFSPILLCRRISRLRLVKEKIGLASILGCVRLGVFLSFYVCMSWQSMCVLVVSGWSFYACLSWPNTFGVFFVESMVNTSGLLLVALEIWKRVHVESMLNTSRVLLVDLGARGILYMVNCVLVSYFFVVLSEVFWWKDICRRDMSIIICTSQKLYVTLCLLNPSCCYLILMVLIN